MNLKKIVEQIKIKKSFLCIGLDTDIQNIPPHLKNIDSAIFEFNKQIIDATNKFAIAYKLNIAFYECMGYKGWVMLEKTVEYLKANYPDIFLIADAKRGDIGNTSKKYAQTFFETLNFDAITVSPYMGEDSVTPFLSYKDKFIILLALTSNKGSNDFQLIKDENGVRLFEHILKKSQNWGNKDNTMYVVGATKPEMFKEVRKIIPDHFLLVPGIGAQGGDLGETVKNGINKNCGLIVNSSRAIIYADNTNKFAEKAAFEAKKIQEEMEYYLEKYCNFM